MQCSSQHTLLPQSNVGCGFIIGRFHPRHNDDGCRLVQRWLHIHDNVFRCSGIPLCLQEVFTARPTLLPLHLNSTPGKHQMAKNRIVFNRCTAYAAVKFITVRVCIDGPCVHDG